MPGDAEAHDPAAVAAAIREHHAIGDRPVPAAVLALAEGRPLDPVWRNELGGLTYRAGDRFVKWNPHDNGIDLDRERARLAWLDGRHPVPRLLAAGGDDEGRWLVTAALPGRSAVAEPWLARPDRAVAAIAAGLRALHAVPVHDAPATWSAEAWPNRTPASLGPRPPIEDPVLVHGDACAPNTLVDGDGSWVANVDVGDLTVADRWADLAVASLSLDRNYGEGHQPAFFAAYGIEPDEARTTYYRALWRLES